MAPVCISTPVRICQRSAIPWAVRNHHSIKYLLAMIQLPLCWIRSGFRWIDAAMPWTLDYSVTDSILTVKCAGRFSAEDLLPMTQAATEKMLAEQTLRVLLDFSTAIANVPIADLYKLPDIYADTRVPRRARLALIVPTDGYRMDIYQFYEDVCVNRGFFVKLFNDVASAKTWLMET
jgi:hypothetical protein